MLFLVLMNKGHEQVWKENNWKRFTSTHIKKVLPIIKENKAKRILDLACGPCLGGAFLLKEKGFNVFGFDASKTAIRKCSEKLEEKKLLIGNMYEKLPYENDFFDCVICFQAINHGTLKEIRNCFSEISRILKKDGLFFVSCGLRNIFKKETKNIFVNEVDNEKWSYSEKDNTFTPITGMEKGILHYFFEENELINELEKYFELQKIENKKIIKAGAKGHLAYARNKK